MKERSLLRLQSLTIGFFSTSSFSEGVRLADKSIRMEGALGSRLSMTFQTCQIPKLRGQYFDMLLNMFYLESYLKDGVARAKIVELPFRLDFLLFVPERLSEGGGSFGRNTFHDISNMQHTEALGPIFRYVAQYIIYRNISDGKRRTNKDCWITFEKELFAVRSRTSSSTKTEFWRENCPCQFKHWKYPSYEANISICCSICSILNLIQRTASLEQRLLNYLWPCDLRAVVNVGTVDRSNCMEGDRGLHDISNIENTQATRPIFRYVAQYVIFWIISDGQHRSLKGC